MYAQTINKYPGVVDMMHVWFDHEAGTMLTIQWYDKELELSLGRSLDFYENIPVPDECFHFDNILILADYLYEQEWLSPEDCEYLREHSNKFVTRDEED